MANLQQKAQRFLPLTESTFYILAALSEPCHGYGIMQRIENATSGRIRLGPGTLYGALTNLQKQKLIDRVDEEGGEGERRKLYVLTDLGRKVARLESIRLAELVRVSRDLLKMNGGNNE